MRINRYLAILPFNVSKICNKQERNGGGNTNECNYEKRTSPPVPLIICIDEIRQVRGLIKVILRRLILG